MSVTVGCGSGVSIWAGFDDGSVLDEINIFFTGCSINSRVGEG